LGQPQTATVSFTIDTEVTPAYFEELLRYTYDFYLIPMGDRVINVRQTGFDGHYVLTFTVLEPKEKRHVNVEMKVGKPIEVRLEPSDASVLPTFLDRLREDLIILVQFFEERVRRATLYFSWAEGREIKPEKSPLRHRGILERILFGNILILFVFFMAVSIVLYAFMGTLAALVIVAFQFVTILFADKIIGSMADWHITRQNPRMHILQYHLPLEVRKDFPQKYPREELLQMKKEIYEKTLALGKPVECETAREVMAEHGLECLPENMKTKTVDVYALVTKSTEKFGLPVPKVAVSNTMVPNAAASGLSPRHGVVLVTTGLLVQLEEEEILTVLGHELSHLRGRDPFFLFGIVSLEYLLHVFFLWPYIMDFFLLYFLLSTGAIYFVAKFFEARADLESAIKIGNPKVLAGALRKIGFRRLQFERVPAARVSDWISWDPHPPIYFRVSRLEKMETPIKVKHTLFRSARDCIKGFLTAF